MITNNNKYNNNQKNNKFNKRNKKKNKKNNKYHLQLMNNKQIHLLNFYQKVIQVNKVLYKMLNKNNKNNKINKNKLNKKFNQNHGNKKMNYKKHN